MSRVSIVSDNTGLSETHSSFLGFTINRLCAASLFTLGRVAPSVSLNARKWATTALGLGVIPFIVHPIDSLVHYGMDNTTRMWIGGVPEKAKAKE